MDDDMTPEMRGIQKGVEAVRADERERLQPQLEQFGRMLEARLMGRQQAMVREWHLRCGHPAPEKPTVEEARTDLRYELIQEELFELDDAMHAEDLVAVADALGDLLFVVYGAAVEYGIDMVPIFNEIVRSNTSKINPKTGEIEYRADGKVLKGLWFSPPELAPILEAQAS